MKLAVVTFILFSVVVCGTDSLSHHEWDFKGFSPELRYHEVFENATHCTPGTHFYLSCNTCYCQESGIKSGSSCDNQGCPPFPPSYKGTETCPSGMHYKDDCNYCTCGSSGIVSGSLCTLMKCIYRHP